MPSATGGGIETLDGEPQDMNNAPSVIVTADGEIVLNYSAKDSRNYADEIDQHRCCASSSPRRPLAFPTKDR